MKVQIRNRVNYTFLESVDVLDRPDNYNYVNRNFSHKDHLKKILNAEEESMELRKEIETLRKEVRRFDLHTANVHKAEEAANRADEGFLSPIQERVCAFRSIPFAEMITTRC